MTEVAELRERLDQLVPQTLTPNSAPGIALALTDRDRLVLAGGYGYANRDAGTPVTAETMFEIGSIGKSFTAIVLLQLRDEGKVDFDVPVATYLPWFTVRTNHAPITIHHLLTHTAGIIGGTDFSPDPRAEVWALRDTETGAPPGERFSYSNLGYKALGLVIETVTGRPYADVVRERIFQRLGMTDSAGAITHALRPRLAVGYTPFYDDRPTPPELPLVPATWLETNTGDGCIATSAVDLATYLRMLLNRGAGPAGRVLGEEAFARMTTPAIAAWDDTQYGYGLILGEHDGVPWLGHSGGMVGYVAEMLGDPVLGVGVAACFNGRFAHGDIVERYALSLLRAWKRGEPLPDVPELPDPTALADPAPFLGEYWKEDVMVEIVATAEGLALTADGQVAPLRRLGGDTFLVEHPRFPLGAIAFGRSRATSDDAATGGEQASEAPVIELVSGLDWYWGERYVATPAAVPPAIWDAYAGHYRSHNPWLSNFRIATGGGRLHLVQQGVHWTPLTALPDGSFRVGDDPRAPERIAFDMLIDGAALRAWYEGAPYYRFFTP